MTAGLPTQLLAVLLETAVERRRPAYLRTDEAGGITARGGALARYGLSEVTEGSPVTQHLDALVGLLPLDSPGVVLPVVATPSGVVADVQVTRAGPGYWVVLLDASEEARRQQAVQQQGNELSLLKSRLARAPAATQPVVAELLALLGVATLEPAGDGALRAVGRQPSWIARVWPRIRAGPEGRLLPEDSPFLEHFLPDAEVCWSADRDTVEHSEIWTEVDRSGREWHLRATAVRLGDWRLLLLEDAAQQYVERSLFLQRARENALEHQRLIKEIEKKDVLLSCIVHDLRSPAASVSSALELIADDVQRAEARVLVEASVAQLKRQDNLIRSILDVFAADLGELEGRRRVEAADVLLVAEAAAETLRPLGALRDVTVTVHAGPGGWKAQAEAARLERVIGNLVDNAIRHSPRGGTVAIRLSRTNDQVTVAVEDAGRGVPPEMAGRLFERFAQGSAQHGASGIGLYFCRMTVQAWGGEIGQENREEGGARFWFRLKSA